MIIDRLQKLLTEQNPFILTGIDFVAVHSDDQTELKVHFHLPEGQSNPLFGNVSSENIHIYSLSRGIPDVPILQDSISWIDSRVLCFKTSLAGDFSLYKIRLTASNNREADHPNIDSYFNDYTFSFKANCPSDLDCEPPPHECPPEEVVDFPINYLARDFWSYRRALLDFATQRYPDWQDRLEADAGVMLVEVMSALADEMAYYQDRIAREAYPETASQRRSIRHHAQLVDYHIHDGLGASTQLELQVSGTGSINAGEVQVRTMAENGNDVYFEIGKGINDTDAYGVDERLNDLAPYIWDEDDVCLKVGTTKLAIIQPTSGAALVQADFKNGETFKKIVLKTFPAELALPQRSHIIQLTKVSVTSDALTGTNLIILEWDSTEALPFEMDRRWLRVRANILPATAGSTKTAWCIIQKDPEHSTVAGVETQAFERAIERQGHDDSIRFRYSLAETENDLLVWQGPTLADARPEVILEEVVFNPFSGEFEVAPNPQWSWKRSFTASPSSQAQDKHFILEDGIWRRIVGYQRIGEEIIHKDYAFANGFSILFGDGEFGQQPISDNLFRVRYRVGGGKQGNVAADTLRHIANNDSTVSINSITNPLGARNGINPETLEEIKQAAPVAFRTITHRAVRPEDYAEAAERLPWVQRAGTAFRWTGSWLSAFTTPDPLDAVSLADNRRIELFQQLDRFRQAGRESHVLAPIYADLDIEITVCAAPHAFKGEVKEYVLEALLGKGGLRPKPGFFAPNNFTFGTPLYRSSLEAAIQAVPGVRAVEQIYIRRRGWFKKRLFLESSYEVGKDTIIRVENDWLHPERGSLNIKMEGGS